MIIIKFDSLLAFVTDEKTDRHATHCKLCSSIAKHDKNYTAQIKISNNALI